MRKLSKGSIFNARQVRSQEIKPLGKMDKKETVVNIESDELQGGEGWMFGVPVENMNVYLDEYE